MNDPFKKPDAPNAGPKTPESTDANLAAEKTVTTGGNISAQGSEKSTRFGGGKAKGRTREDGLTPGSPEARSADLAKDAKRKRDERAAKAATSQPATLPSVPDEVQGALRAAGYDTTDLSGPAVGSLDDAPVAFAPWQARTLEKPVKLITKIVDKVRCYFLMQKIRKLGLKPEQQKEIEDGMKWQEDTVKDFNTALTECAAIELNKRRVPGANQSHWITLGIAGGEMAVAHMDTMKRLEQMVIENKAHAVSTKSN